jgi:hypothetical protein
LQLKCHYWKSDISVTGVLENFMDLFLEIRVERNFRMNSKH